jgi:ferredoxin-NADP reductase
MISPSLNLRVKRFAAEAKDVALLELQALEGCALPSFQPGAHIEVRLGNGAIRHYSLLNDPIETHRYVIAVGLSPESRGGSRFIHTVLRQNDVLQASAPRNIFLLDTEADHFCFIAGGIGITPILSMIRWCVAHRKTWRLIYTARNRQRAAFYEDLLEFGGRHVRFHFTDEHNGQFLDIPAVVDALSEDEQVYCCGPNALMQAVKHSTEHLPASQVHFEWFAAPSSTLQAESVEDGQLSVTLKSSGKSFDVGPSQSILEALEAQGIEVPFSCRSGICATCETNVCEGIPDHRDFVLSNDQQLEGKTIMICVSRSLTKSLVLDL